MILLSLGMEQLMVMSELPLDELWIYLLHDSFPMSFHRTYKSNNIEMVRQYRNGCDGCVHSENIKSNFLPAN